MSYFRLKFWLFVLSVTVFVGCWLFLFFNHNDHLVKYVPAQAEAYFHTTTQNLLKIPEKQRIFYLSWLEDKSAMSAGRWQSILEHLDEEVGFFSLNGQVFAVAKDTQKTLELISRNETSFTREGKVLFFPRLTVSADKLHETEWFKQTRRKIAFTNFLIYIKDIRTLKIPFVADQPSSPLALAGSAHENTLCLKTHGLTGQEVGRHEKPQISVLPADTSAYFNNIFPGKIVQNAEYSPQNFIFHLLKSLNGAVEFAQTPDGFMIIASQKENPTEQLQSFILNILAQTLPSEKSKLLPDQTTAIQYIADPNAWKFETVVSDYQQQYILTEPKINLDLRLTEVDGQLIINNNFPHESIVSSPANINTTSCSGMFSKNCLYIKPQSAELSNFFNHIVLRTGIFNQNTICID